MKSMFDNGRFFASPIALRSDLRQCPAEPHTNEVPVRDRERARRHRRSRNKWLLAGLGIIAAAVTGCGPNVDVDQVKKFAAAAASAAPSFDAMAVDYNGTCERGRELKADFKFASTPSSPLAPPDPKASPTAIPINEVNDKCAKSAAIASDWRIVNNLLLDYIAGLGNIANVTTAPTGVDKLTGSLKSGGLLTADQASALAPFITDLISQIEAAKQRAAIAHFASWADPSVKIVIERLTFVAGTYKTVLDDEGTRTDQFFSDQIVAETTNHAPSIVLLGQRDDWLARRERVAAHGEAAVAYLDALKKLGDMQTTLASASTTNDLSSFVAVAKEELSPLVTDLKTVEAAFAAKK
jgi:hypothetical protein